MCCVALALPAFASAVLAVENENFGLTPSPERSDDRLRGAFSIPLERGATFEDSVRVYNRTDQTLELAVYATDAEASEEQIRTVGLRSSEPKGVGAWIDLAREDVELGPRDEAIITFRVEVKSSDPSPSLGAIVVENTGPGLTGNAAQREFLVVNTTGPNNETTSVRVRPLLLRSPWIIVALLGLVVAIALVWVGARRARRPKDILVPAGELEDDGEDMQESSRPVIKRLGAVDEPSTAVIDPPRKQPRKNDDRPLLDDALLVEVDPDDEEEDDDDGFEADDAYEDDVFEDEEEDELPVAKHRPAPARKRKPAVKTAAPQTGQAEACAAQDLTETEGSGEEEHVTWTQQARSEGRELHPARRPVARSSAGGGSGPRRNPRTAPAPAPRASPMRASPSSGRPP